MNSQELLLEKGNGVRIIKFNRPNRKNAMSPEIYLNLTKLLNEDAKDDSIVITILTGVGDYYSSGNDITAPSNLDINERLNLVHDMVTAFINYPKIIISVVNGPAIGIAATTAALCDIVYASDRAIFDTPFLKLGLCCEACSSYTFPAILGRSKASEVLLLNHKLTAQEAYLFGFVSKVIPHDQLNEFIIDLHKYGSLSPNSVKLNKKLITRNFTTLNECNNIETKALHQCVNSEEFNAAIMQFLKRRSKL